MQARQHLRPQLGTGWTAIRSSCSLPAFCARQSHGRARGCAL